MIRFYIFQWMLFGMLSCASDPTDGNHSPDTVSDIGSGAPDGPGSAGDNDTDSAIRTDTAHAIDSSGTDDPLTFPLATVTDTDASKVQIFDSFLGGFNVGVIPQTQDQDGNTHWTRYATNKFAVSDDQRTLYFSGSGNEDCDNAAVIALQIPSLTMPRGSTPYPDTSFFDAATVVEQSWWNVFSGSNMTVTDDCNHVITQMEIFNGGELWVGGIRPYPAYNGPGTLLNNLMIVREPQNMSSGGTHGQFNLGANADTGAFFHGWVGSVPTGLQSVLGGDCFAGGAHEWSINGRSSNGPTLGIFNCSSVPTGAATQDNKNIPVKILMAYPLENELGTNVYDPAWQAATGETWNDKNCTAASFPDCITGPPTPWHLVEPCNGETCDIPMWTVRSRAFEGFFVPGTRTYAVLGRTECLETGCAYKVYREGFSEANATSGNAPVKADDIDGYYWLFDLKDILSATNSYDPVPYEHGKLPFIEDYISELNPNEAKGAVTDIYYNEALSRLYFSLNFMAEGDGDSPPAIIVWQVPQGG